MYDLLAERDALSEDPELWAVNAALDGQKLQNSFTFVNLLSRLLSDVIKKLLSYMIPLIDLNSNLDLIDTADEQSILCQLWLSAFLNETFFQLRYTDFATSGSNTVEVSKQRYNCQFPFSWEMIDQVDAVCTNVIPSAAGKLLCYISPAVSINNSVCRWTECPRATCCYFANSSCGAGSESDSKRELTRLL